MTMIVFTQGIGAGAQQGKGGWASAAAAPGRKVQGAPKWAAKEAF